MRGLLLPLLAAFLQFGTPADAHLPAGGSGVVIRLYANGEVPPLGVPESREVIAETGETMIFNVSEPTIEMFRPPDGRATGTAMIVAPGGGFIGIGYQRGGIDIARRLTAHGITAFVLKYRTIRSPDDAMHMPEVHLREMDKVIARAKTGQPRELPPFAGEAAAVADGGRAIALVRRRAAEWGIDPRKVGMIGLSAGAYLAADLAIGAKATRPNFVALLYGGLRSPVPTDAPPAFIAGAADDPYQPDDPLLLFSAWKTSEVPAELHVYERGGHGFDLGAQGTTSDHWFDALIQWLKARGLKARLFEQTGVDEQKGGALRLRASTAGNPLIDLCGSSITAQVITFGNGSSSRPCVGRWACRR